MRINKRLIGTVSESKKYIAGNVALQWCAPAANILVMAGIAGLPAALAAHTACRVCKKTAESQFAISIIIVPHSKNLWYNIEKRFCEIWAKRGRVCGWDNWN